MDKGMKKKRPDRQDYPDKWKKIVLVMKLACFLTLFLSLSATASLYSQHEKVTMTIKREPLAEVLLRIKDQTGVKILYNENLLQGFFCKKMNFDRSTVEEVLKTILNDTGLGYSVVEGVIVITEQTPLPSSPQTSITIKVRVTDKDSIPIPGVTVRIKNQSLAASTDRDGRVSLVLPQMDKPVLVFSFIGMKTKEVVFIGQSLIRVVMEEDIAALEDVVVTGYANIRKESFTGSSTKVSREELQKVGPYNLIKSLQVFDPSFRVVQNNEMGSNPNTMPEYYIRGRSGTSELKQLDVLTTDDVSQFALVNNPSAPIFILDGFEVSQSKIYDMDLNRIESVTLLKDAAATAVYGARAANGVVVIESVAPQPGEIQVSYFGTLAASFPDLSSYDLMNAAETLEAERLAGLYNGASSANMAKGVIAYMQIRNQVLRGVDTDWISKPLTSEFNHSHTLYLSGGSQELRWGLDANYRRNKGVMKGSYRNTYGAALTVDYRWRNIQIKNKADVTLMESEDSPYGTFSDYVRMKPHQHPKDGMGNYIKIFNYTYHNTTGTVNNPLYEASVGNYTEKKYTEFSDNLSLIWRSSNFFWTVRGNLGISFKLEDNNKFMSPHSGTFFKASVSDFEWSGTLATSEVRTNSWNADLGVSYTQTIDGHNMNFRIGVELAENKSTSLSASYRGFTGEHSSPAHAAEIVNKPTYMDANSRRMGAFLQMNYSYMNIYLFDLSGRLDGSSAFGSDKKVAPFWSGGVGLNVHHYPFMNKLPALNLLKLSATYGQTGKANFSPYQAKTTYKTLFDTHYARSTGMVLKALGNTELKWEKARTWNFRGEVGVLDNKLNLQFEYYVVRTVDMVEQVTIPASSGFTYYKGNVGEVKNKGFEFELSWRILENQDWGIIVSNAINRNKNEIVKIGEALQEYNSRVDTYFSKYSTVSTDNTFTIPFMKYEEGSSLSAIYGMKSLGIDPARGDELYVKRDGTTTHVWSSAEQQKLGDTEPKIQGSLQLNLRWKDLTLYTSFLYRYGGQAYNQTYQAIENVNLRIYGGDRRILSERWRKVGNVTKLKDIADQTQLTRPTSRFVQDENQFQFNSLSLAYNLKREMLRRAGISSLRFQFNMTDIATISSIKRERGTAYPFARGFNLSVNLTF